MMCKFLILESPPLADTVNLRSTLLEKQIAKINYQK